MNKSFMQKGSAMASWHAVVQEAEGETGILLHEHVEHYLVSLLHRYTDKPGAFNQALGEKYLKSVGESAPDGSQGLQEVGDECLLVAGFFPGRAQKKWVRVGYYIDLGRMAYTSLSHDRSVRHCTGLYSELADEFVPLVDVLLAIRQVDEGLHLSAMQRIELWGDVYSRYTAENRQRYQQSFGKSKSWRKGNP